MDQVQRNSENLKDIKLSKSLSWLLRHGAETEGLYFDDGGFIDVQKILKLKQFHSYNQADILRVVEKNDKKRFTIRCINEGSCLQVRANQGHSLKVNEDGLLTLLTDVTAPHVVYHGTYFSKMESIRMKGLNRMNRNHIHFSPKFPGAAVTSGMRENCEVAIAVDTLKAMRDGYKFYVSDNGVVLCPGNESSVIPTSYFTEIWQLSPLKKLDGVA